MSKEDMIQNLGTIARSGSKAFMDEMKEQGQADPNAIIGQFGVGFYSAFMVADKIEVYSLASEPGSVAHHWESDGTGKKTLPWNWKKNFSLKSPIVIFFNISGSYTISEAQGVKEGTKVIIHLKEDCSEFADHNKVRDIIKKYSSFVGSTLYIDGDKASDLQPVWLMDPKSVDADTHEGFYR